MSSSVGLLEFFIVEATEHVSSLQALFGSSGATGPDAQAVLRHARALRGSATMSRHDGIALVARALERVAHALRDGTLRWDPPLAAALRAALDETRGLAGSLRAWGAAEEARARSLASELESYGAAPPARVATGAGAEGIVPIEQLFPDEPGVHLLYAAPCQGAAAGAEAAIAIDELLYRGRAALERARALRDEMRSRSEPPGEALAELFDLLDLAATE